MNGRTQMRKISLFAVCPECGATLCSERCWSCDGTAASWITICEECGGGGQLLLCPNRACHSPPPPDYWRGSEGNSVTHSVADATRNWCFDSGRPAELNNLRRAGCRLRNADDAARNIQRAPIRLHFASDAPAELKLAWLTLQYPLTDPSQFDQ